jgi:hypothetical protein
MSEPNSSDRCYRATLATSSSWKHQVRAELCGHCALIVSASSDRSVVVRSLERNLQRLGRALQLLLTLGFGGEGDPAFQDVVIDEAAAGASRWSCSSSVMVFSFVALQG